MNTMMTAVIKRDSKECGVLWFRSTIYQKKKKDKNKMQQRIITHTHTQGKEKEIFF